MSMVNRSAFAAAQAAQKIVGDERPAGLPFAAAQAAQKASVIWLSVCAWFAAAQAAQKRNRTTQ